VRFEVLAEIYADELVMAVCLVQAQSARYQVPEIPTAAGLSLSLLHAGRYCAVSRYLRPITLAYGRSSGTKL
jgi:hypothetical protein